MKIRIAILASGTGSNALNICRYFATSDIIEVGLIASNRKEASIVPKAKELGYPVIVFSRRDLMETDHLLCALKDIKIDYLILAGFLWLIPTSLLEAFPGRIINIHPSLLPSFGGKGMYGDKVHEAVLSSGNKYSGITIHTIDEEYDRGNILLQARCPVEKEDDVQSLREKIQLLEHTFFPRAIEAHVRFHLKQYK